MVPKFVLVVVVVDLKVAGVVRDCEAMMTALVNEQYPNDPLAEHLVVADLVPHMCLWSWFHDQAMEVAGI